MGSFDVHPLRLSELGTVYPLIRQAAPMVDLKAWARFARHAADPRSRHLRGVIIAQHACLTHPSGLFCYTRELDLTYGAVLSASHFIVLDMFKPEAVMTALVEALEELSRKLGCTVIRTTSFGGVGDAAASLLAAGHHVEGTSFVKPVRQISRPRAVCAV